LEFLLKFFNENTSLQKTKKTEENFFPKIFPFDFTIKKKSFQDFVGEIFLGDFIQEKN